MKTKILNWLANGDTGLSSKAIAFHLSGIRIKNRYDRKSHPADPADFKRCLALIEYIPELGGIKMACCTLSPEWDAVMCNWQELERMLAVEIGWTKELAWKHDYSKPAPKTYKRMKSLGL